MPNISSIFEQEYAFRLAMCLLANFDLKLTPDAGGYVPLDDIIKDSWLAGKGGNKYPEPEAVVAQMVAAAKAEEESGRHWQVKQVPATGDNKALLLTHGKEVRVFFPGTAFHEVQDVIADLDTLSTHFVAHEVNGVKDVHCKVDRGFLHRTGSISEEIVQELNALREKGECERLSINGYSMGAGMAAVFAVGLPKELRDKVENLVTLAPPHVGDKQFSEVMETLFGGRTFNVRNAHDPVVEVPTWFETLPGEAIDISGQSKAGQTEHRLFTNTRTTVGNFMTKNPDKDTALDVLSGMVDGHLQIQNHYPMAYFRGIEASKHKGPGALDETHAAPLIEPFARSA